jgi:hypothetical protein
MIGNEIKQNKDSIIDKDSIIETLRADIIARYNENSTNLDLHGFLSTDDIFDMNNKYNMWKSSKIINKNGLDNLKKDRFNFETIVKSIIEKNNNNGVKKSISLVKIKNLPKFEKMIETINQLAENKNEIGKRIEKIFKIYYELCILYVRLKINEPNIDNLNAPSYIAADTVILFNDDFNKFYNTYIVKKK